LHLCPDVDSIYFCSIFSKRVSVHYLLQFVISERGMTASYEVFEGKITDSLYSVLLRIQTKMPFLTIDQLFLKFPHGLSAGTTV